MVGFMQPFMSGLIQAWVVKIVPALSSSICYLYRMVVGRDLKWSINCWYLIQLLELEVLRISLKWLVVSIGHLFKCMYGIAWINLEIMTKLMKKLHMVLSKSTKAIMNVKAIYAFGAKIIISIKGPLHPLLWKPFRKHKSANMNNCQGIICWFMVACERLHSAYLGWAKYHLTVSVN